MPPHLPAVEVFNAAKEIAEFEKKTAAEKSPATISATVTENPAVFVKDETEGKSQKMN